MKMIFKIAKKELQLLFYSPIAWLLLFAFIIQVAVRFVPRYQAVVYTTADATGFTGISEYVFSAMVSHSGGGLWVHVQRYLFLYIPLLTMGIVSREINSGAIRLMYSSPVNNLQIILGKYVALFGYAVLLVLPLLVYVLFGWLTIKEFEIAWVMAGLFGLFLLICTYMAIGIFVSSLTTHQSIAAISSFLIFGFLGVIGSQWQQYELVRDIAYWLSVNGRVETFIRGVICSEDVVYFIAVSITFIALTVIRLHAIRQKQRLVVSLGKNMLVILLLCGVALLSSRPALTAYCDVTTTYRNSLSEPTREIMKQLRGKTTVTAYINIFDRQYGKLAYPGFVRANRQAFRQYLHLKSDLAVRTVYYYTSDCVNKNMTFLNAFPGLTDDQLADEFCRKNGIKRKMLKNKAEVDRMTDLSQGGYGCIREFVSEEGKRVRTDFSGDERAITIAFKRLIKTLPEIGYLTGNRERGLYDETLSGYSKALERGPLWNQGIGVEEVNLDVSLPLDRTFLMLADPREKISPEHQAVLKDYIDSGGNLMILGEPRRRDILNPLLREWFGVELTPLVVHPDVRGNYAMKPDVLHAFVQPAYQDAGMVFLRPGARIGMVRAAGLEVVADKGFQVSVFAQTDTLGSSWTELETTDFENDTVRFNPAAGEVCKVFPLVLELTRQVNGREQKVILFGDADVFANEMFIRKISGANAQLFTDIVYGMSQGDAPLLIRRALTSDNRVCMTVKQFDYYKWIFLLLLPLLVAIGGVVLWIRRKGR